MAEIVRWRRKPEKDKSPQVAARWLPPEKSLAAFREIAHMADSGAQVTLLAWAGTDGNELCVRYTKADRDSIEYVHVSPGQWLAYAPDGDFLYVSGQHDWERWYERVDGEGDG